MNVRPFLSSLALLAAASLAQGETVWFDRVHGTEGVDSSYGGAWSLSPHSGSQQYWTTDGGLTWRDWTSADAANVAAFVSSVGLNMAVSAADGAVAAKGIEITTSGEGKGATFGGDAISLGAGGLTYVSQDVNALLKFNAPLVLAASQTWRSYNDSTKLTAGTMVQVYGDVSVPSGTSVALTLDGAGRRNPVISQGADLLTGFGFYAPLTAVKTLVLTNGVTFAPMYTAAYPTAKLSPEATLVLAGGSVSPRGTDCSEERVAKTRLVAGENQIRGYNAKGTVALGVLEREVGATLDLNNASYGGTITTTANDDVAMLGWASFAKGMFAEISGGTFVQVSEKQRGVDNWDTTGTTSVRATSGGTFTLAFQNPATLRIYTSDAIDLKSCEVTIATGGFMTSLPGILSGGTFKTGAATGELCAHVFADYTLGSVLADNGDVALKLVKGGDKTLTLTARSTATGMTYLNAGRLVYSGAARLDVPLVQQANATLVFADGGTFALAADAPRVLHGNLELNAGAKIEAVLGGSLCAARKPLVTMDTPLFKQVTVADGVKIPLSVSVRTLDGAPDRLVKGVYPIFVTTDANPAAVAGLSPEDFELALPDGVEGTLEKRAEGLVLKVTKAPSKGLVIMIR